MSRGHSSHRLRHCNEIDICIFFFFITAHFFVCTFLFGIITLLLINKVIDKKISCLFLCFRIEIGGTISAVTRKTSVKPGTQE